MDLRERVARELYVQECEKMAERSGGLFGAQDLPTFDDLVPALRDPFFIRADRLLAIMGEDGRRLDVLRTRILETYDAYNEGDVSGDATLLKIRKLVLLSSEARNDQG